MTHDSYSDSNLAWILTHCHRIAIVGASANETRPSYIVLKYLLQKGFEVIAVNPGLAGRDIAGAPVYASLADIPGKVDMVDVFRASEHVGPVIDEAIAIGARVIWMQLGIRNDEAAAKAEAAGLQVVMNRCPKIEFARIFG